MSEFLTLRRCYLKQRVLKRQADELAASAVFQSHQEEQPGTALPADFPARAQLVTGGYATREDLDGADPEEVADWASISIQSAKAVLAAVAAL